MEAKERNTRETCNIGMHVNISYCTVNGKRTHHTTPHHTTPHHTIVVWKGGFWLTLAQTHIGILRASYLAITPHWRNKNHVGHSWHIPGHDRPAPWSSRNPTKCGHAHLNLPIPFYVRCGLWLFVTLGMAVYYSIRIKKRRVINSVFARGSRNQSQKQYSLVNLYPAPPLQIKTALCTACPKFKNHRVTHGVPEQ